MRLIDADALRNKLQEEIDKASPPYNDVIGSIRCGVRLARNIVEDEPTIDAKPVKRGKWIESDEYDEFCGRLYRCSNCNTFVIGDMDNYCPFCGARMYDTVEEVRKQLKDMEQRREMDRKK